MYLISENQPLSMFASDCGLFMLQVRCGRCQELPVFGKVVNKTACFARRDTFHTVSLE